MRKQIVTTIFLLIAISLSFGVPIAPQIVEYLKETGQLAAVVQADKDAREKGVWAPNDDPYQFGLTTDVDTLNCLIVLVDFSDMPYTNGYVADVEDFDSLLFSQDVYVPGSMTDYYWETSYGQAFVQGQVTEWIRMPQTYAYYVDGQRGFGQYPQNAQKLTEDAVIAADPDVDFSLYDNDGDSFVDALFIVHAGPGYEDTGNTNYIHSHAWSTTYNMLTDDEVYVRRYSMEPEETGGNQLVHIGVFCHEYGHVLGLPDLYDYDYDSDGTGMWSIMSGGSWGGGGIRPVHFDAWSKMDLGWVSPITPEDNLENVQLPAVEFNPVVYRLFSQGNPGYQYFLVENRQQYSFDLSLPGQGLLILHVDDLVDNNNNQNHYHVAVEQADGMFHLENNQGSDPGDPWPGTSYNTTFDDFSTPNAWLYGSGPSEVAVSSISETDSVMYADLYVMYNEPLYELLNISFENDDNDNGIPEAGESCELIFTAQNIRIEADDLVVQAECSDPSIEMIDDESSFGELPVNVPFDNSSDPIALNIPADFEDNYVTFTLTFSSNSGAHQQQFDYTLLIGTPDVFIVDDDRGDELESYYTDALDALGLLYVVWDVEMSGPPSAVINQYETVIWFTGDSSNEPMSEDNVFAIIDYFDHNGKLLITSQDLVEKLADRAESYDLLLLNSYLKVDYDMREQNHFIIGEPGTQFDGFEFLTVGDDGAYNQNSQDALEVLDGGVTLATYNPGTVAAVGASGGGYSSVVVGFGIEGINDTYGDFDNRADFILASLQFMETMTSADEIETILPVNTALAQNYPNPFNAKTIIEFNLAAPSNVKLEIFDLLGRSVETLADAEFSSGTHQVTWAADDYTSGVYFYRLQTQDRSETRQMLLLK